MLGTNFRHRCGTKMRFNFQGKGIDTDPACGGNINSPEMNKFCGDV